MHSFDIKEMPSNDAPLTLRASASAYACILHYVTVVYAQLVPEGTGNLRTNLLGRDVERSWEGHVLFTLSPLATWKFCTNGSQMCISHLKQQN